MKNQFQVWAPNANTLSLILLLDDKEKVYPMQKKDKGIFEIILSDLPSTVDYLYCIDGDKRRPDPRSRWQPHGVHGPSRLVNTKSFSWSDQNWKNIPLSDYIIYELHVGTFTPEGTFESAIEKLPYLKKLGITAIEIMPVITFPGQKNWGYDGTYPYAPHHGYGGPFGLQHFIDASHKEGLAVILDVVYNHLGPEGNYLSEFGPYYTDHYKTPWGQAINFDGSFSDPVRQYFVQNALFWVLEYHFDALRLDAIQTIFDFGAKHILEQMQAALKNQKRAAYLIAESDLNDVRILNPREKGGYQLDAQWHDDFHHALYSVITKSSRTYLSDFGQIEQLARAIQEGFVYDGRYSEYRKKTFGSSSKDIQGDHLVICIQNHDQVGNGCNGKRLSHIVGKKESKLAAVILMTAPFIPLLFMGQEWSASTLFTFFTSFEDKTVITNVLNGRAKEHAFENTEYLKPDLPPMNGSDSNSFPLEARKNEGAILENITPSFSEPEVRASREKIISNMTALIGGKSGLNPQDPICFLQSKLKWDELEEPEHAEMVSFYRKIIHLRKKHPCLSNCRKDLTKTTFNEEKQWLIIYRKDPSGSEACILANFAQKAQMISHSFQDGSWTLLLDTSEGPTNNALTLNPSNAKIYLKKI